MNELQERIAQLASGIAAKLRADEELDGDELKLIHDMHDQGKSPRVKNRTQAEIAHAADQLLFWARYLEWSSAASLTNYASGPSDVSQKIIHVREAIAAVCRVIELPAPGNLTAPSGWFPI